VSAASAVLAGQFVLLALLGAALLRRGAVRSYPVFCTYIAASFCAVLAQWASSGNRVLYFKVFWITHALGSLLAIAAIYETFALSFRGYFVLRWFRLLLPAVAVIVAAYAIWKSFAHPPVLGSPLVNAVIGVEIGVQYLIVATFICYAALHKVLDVSYSSFRYGVAAGFGLASFGMLAATLLRSEFGTRFHGFITWAPSVAYFLALLVWTGSSSIPLADEREIPGADRITAADALDQLQQYRTTLEKARK